MDIIFKILLIALVCYILYLTVKEKESPELSNKIKPEDKEKPIRHFKTMANVFIALGVISSIVILFAFGIVEEYRSIYGGREWKVYPGGIFSAIATLFTTFLFYSACRVLIFIARK